MNKNCNPLFLTGSTGFVGGALLGRLLSELHEVKALVRKRADVLPNAVEQVVGDLALLVHAAARAHIILCVMRRFGMATLFRT
jgi:uncharacterized protein YbjT (DUF2867 family)